MALTNGQPRVGKTTNRHTRSRQAGIKFPGASKPLFGAGPTGKLNKKKHQATGQGGTAAGSLALGTVSGGQRLGTKKSQQPNIRSGRKAGVGGQTPIPQAIARGPKRRTTKRYKDNRRRRP